MIVGVGIDVVPVARFAEALARRPGLAARLFTPAERTTHAGVPRSTESLAARFAAKEALAKSLGAGGGMLWTDAEVVVDDAGLASLPAPVEVRASDPPVASATGPRTGRSGQPVTLDASTSADPDGTIVAYEWRFGDGTDVVVTTGPVVTHTYVVDRPTVFGWSVTVVDDTGGRDAVGDTLRITR